MKDNADCHRAQRAYEAAFHSHKPDKRLRWLQSLGTATIRLELADRVVEVEATPLQASIAELFEDRDTWSVTELCEKLGIEDEEVIVNGLTWWLEHAVVKEDAGVWRLLDHAESVEDPLIRELSVKFTPG